MVKGKKILLGITGSIAAYKAAILVRLLVKAEAEVKIIMTPFAREFVTTGTLSTLSGHPVLTDFFKSNDGTWNSHVDLGNWADVFLIAPATANTLGKMVNGIADNLLIATYLSAKCPVIIAPAMDLDMFRHPSTTKNLNALQEYGHMVIEPDAGDLASGLSGKGRLKEPEDIVAILASFFSKKKRFKEKHFLVTAGPTYEYIDPVRFIGNFSSGKMGYAIAHELAESGAKVTLVSGPVNEKTFHPLIEVIPVVTTEEMYQACMEVFSETDGALLAAAVSDYKADSPSEHKIKSGSEWELKLRQTHDVAQELGRIKTNDQILAGFALETDNEKENAINKLKKKNFDFIVLNSLNDQGAGFNKDTNKISIIDNKMNIQQFDLKMKQEAAKDIVNKLAVYYD